MITHQIVKHKPRIKLPEIVGKFLPVVPTTHIPPIRNNSGVCVHLGKIDYGKFIEKLRLKIGQYCFYKGTDFPVQNDKIWKVVGINELHYMDKGNNIKDKSPTPYYLKNQKGEESWANDELLIGFARPDLNW